MPSGMRSAATVCWSWVRSASQMSRSIDPLVPAERSWWATAHSSLPCHHQGRRTAIPDELHVPETGFLEPRAHVSDAVAVPPLGVEEDVEGEEGPFHPNAPVLIDEEVVDDDRAGRVQRPVDAFEEP